MGKGTWKCVKIVKLSMPMDFSQASDCLDARTILITNSYSSMSIDWMNMHILFFRYEKLALLNKAKV